jgi:NAD(P)-dependent dehydrogenase (short-subunit alcohol dehydrogenase family)
VNALPREGTHAVVTGAGHGIGAAITNIVVRTRKSEAGARAALTARNPQGRVTRPDEVANNVAWLCGEGAASITGQATAVAGGEIR